jgi:hypothetical protein
VASEGGKVRAGGCFPGQTLGHSCFTHSAIVHSSGIAHPCQASKKASKQTSKPARVSPIILFGDIYFKTSIITHSMLPIDVFPENIAGAGKWFISLSGETNKALLSVIFGDMNV